MWSPNAEETRHHALSPKFSSPHHVNPVMFCSNPLSGNEHEKDYKRSTNAESDEQTPDGTLDQ